MGCGGTKILDLRDVYDIGDKLGAGAFGQVRVATHKKTGNVRAVKVIWKEEQGVTIDELMEEIYVMRLMDHPLIVHLYDFFEDEHFLYTIIDSYTGGELFQKLSSTNLVKESDACRYIRMMVEAVQYLGTVGVVHRDIKPENFLFADKTPTSDLCMIDFGLSQRIVGDEWLSVCCGTVQYLSPEQIQGKYRYTGDMWSVGVIGYLLLYGKFPFAGSSDSRIMYEIMSVEPNFKSKTVSPKAQEFLQRMIIKDPNKRIKPGDALSHAWMKAPEAELSGVIDNSTIKQAQQEWQMSRREVSQDVEQRRNDLQSEMTKVKSSDQKKRLSLMHQARPSLLIPGAEGPHAVKNKHRASNVGLGGAPGQGWAPKTAGDHKAQLGLVPEGGPGQEKKRMSFLPAFGGNKPAIQPALNLPAPKKDLHRDENLENLARVWRKSNSVAGDVLEAQVAELAKTRTNTHKKAGVVVNDEGAARPRTMSIQCLPSEEQAKNFRKAQTKDLADQFRPNAQVNKAMSRKDVPDSRMSTKNKDAIAEDKPTCETPEVEEVA